MPKGTDSASSSSSSSTEEYRKRKSSKSSKRKTEKKHKKHKKEKRHKQKKRSRRSSSSSNEAVVSVPAQTSKVLPLCPAVTAAATNAVDVDAFGPALPPHLLQKQNTVIGPVIPSSFPLQIDAETAEKSFTDEAQQSQASAATHKAEEDHEDAVGIYGPVPFDVCSELQMSTAQIELEQRALELKLAAIDGASARTVDQKVREEWMLELPEVGLKTGLAALNNLKRTFHQGKERPDFSDRTSWTKTPQSETNPKPATSKTIAEDMERDAQAIYARQRDEEQESIAKKHKKKHKRDESLVAMHQKKLRKEQKQREKELAAAGATAERRPFSRDVDLKPNIIDKNQTKKIVDKAKILNTKFSSGHTKYL